MVEFNNDELRIFTKEYDETDYDSITKIFRLLHSDYANAVPVYGKKFVENKPSNTENNLYMLFKGNKIPSIIFDKLTSENHSEMLKTIFPKDASLPYFGYFGICSKEFKGPKEDFYIAYLFNKDVSKAFLTLELGSNNTYSYPFLKQYEDDDLELARDKFKEEINKYHSKILNDFEIDLNNFEDDIDLGRINDSSHINQDNKANNYEKGAIFVKSYDIENLPSEEDLIKDLNDFNQLYDFILREFKCKTVDGSYKLDFNCVLSLIRDLLKKLGTEIEISDYDGLIVKRITDNDGPKKGRHIALLTPHENMFPCFESNGYLEDHELNKTLKKYFIIKIPVCVKKSNLCYIKNEEFDSNEKIYKTHTTILRSKTASRKQLEIAHSSFDGEKFNLLSKEFDENYYLIILKIKGKLSYEAYGILPEDSEALHPLSGKFFYKENTATPVFVEDLLEEDNILNLNRVKSGRNVLLYGVPGSGKSRKIQEEYCNDDSKMERVIFHPDYSYSDFVGQILPEVSDDGQISYDFFPGPFTEILKKAYFNPYDEYFLIIEEINRGNAPAIFGDIFQLLDRKKEDDEGSYPIGTSEYGITNYDIAEQIYGKDNKSHKIRIPSNLSIIATMNTSDQNVFSLDTAFQRRWEMEMVENEFKNKNDKLKEQEILDTGVEWGKFWEVINRKIREENSINLSSEDKQLGAYFIQLSDIKDTDQNRKFAEKVLKYLWDDAFKFSRGNVFRKNDDTGLEDIIKSFTDSTGKKRFYIFENNVLSSLGIEYEMEDKENGPE